MKFTEKSRMLLGVILNKWLTYPIVALSSLINYRIIGHNFGENQQARFILLWSILGLVVLIEYSIGIKITNDASRDIEPGILKFRILKSMKFSSFVLFICYISFMIIPIFQNLAIFSIRDNSNSNSPSLILSFIICCGLNSFTQIILRYYSGIGLFKEIQKSQMFAAVISSLVLATVLKFSDSFSLALLAASSNYATQIPILALLDKKKSLRRLFASNKVEPPKEQNLYTAILLSISLLSVALQFAPRVYVSRYSIPFEISKYSYFVIISTSIFSIMTSLGPVFWRESIRNEYFNRKSLSDAYRLIWIALIPLGASMYLLFQVIPVVLAGGNPIKIDNFLILASFGFLAVQSLHLVASNVLNQLTELAYQALFLLLQTSAIGFFLIYWQSSATALGMVVGQASVFLLFGLVPTFLLLRFRKLIS